MAQLAPFSEVERLDRALVRLGRGASALRFAVGAALDKLSSSGGHHELGFSSLEAYARERCERSGRWAADARTLARRLSELPRIRVALLSGELGSSAAELLACHVTAETELEWLERARRATVRELRALLARQDADDVDEPDATRSLTVRATREEAWVFECARKVGEAVAGPMSPDRLLQALLVEGYTTLLDFVPEDAQSDLHEIEQLEFDAGAESEARARFRSERGHWQAAAEELCEARVVPPANFEPFGPNGTPSTGSEWSPPGAAEALDREIRHLCSELAERDLALGILAESARKAQVWRRLGFASEAQYARERVGVSLSSLKAKRILAARAARVPALATALARGRLGYEAAYLLSRVVTASTAEEWISRAEGRTIKHLREEVEAAELLIRMGQGRDQMPLDQRSLEDLFELERSIVSGEPFERVVISKSPPMASGQTSGTRRASSEVLRFGRVKLRWVVTEGTYRFWRALERVFMRVRSRMGLAPSSFLGFLCESFCRLWLPALRHECLTESGETPEYFGVYRRDGFRCSSPVCTRRDVTPHHLVFRAHGGGDDDENVASLCVWCHLYGIHGGRIGAEPPASNIRWRIGRRGTVHVEGRTRRAA
jgi:hypothetical protein